MKRLIFAVLMIMGMHANAAGIASFIWDDQSRSHNGWVAPYFESKGIRAGFAISAGKVQSDWTLGMTFDQMLIRQNAGHEFIAHGFMHTSMASVDTPLSTVKSELITGIAVMRSKGLNVSAFVAPNSAVHATFVTPHVRSLYQYAFTVYSAGVADAVQQMPFDPHRLHRTSLFAVGIAGAKQAIDAAVASDGLVVFYDHDPLLTDYQNSMPYSDVQQVVTYAQSKGITILPPSAAIKEAERRYTNSYVTAMLRKK